MARARRRSATSDQTGKRARRIGVAALGHATGAALENQLLAHPFYDERDIPLILGDHVSDQDGTGAVTRFEHHPGGQLARQ